jgi:predicted HTH domain antitoxin
MTMFYDLYIRSYAQEEYLNWRFIKRTPVRDLAVADADRAIDQGFFAKIREFERDVRTSELITEEMLCAAEEEGIPFAELELQIAAILEQRRDPETLSIVQSAIELFRHEPVDVTVGQISALASALGYEVHVLLRERGEHIELITEPYPKHECGGGDNK